MDKVMDKAASQGWTFAAVCGLCNQGFALYRPADKDDFICGLCKKYSSKQANQQAGK